MGKILSVFGEHDEKTMVQLNDVASRAEYAALMADGHLGYVMPIGGVAAYRNQVSVVGVGFDIACGNAAIKTTTNLAAITKGEITVEEARTNPHRLQQDPWLVEIANEIANTVSFGIGRKNTADDAPTNHPLFKDPAWYHIPNVGRYRDDLRDKAIRQLGTVGSGNHYVDVFYDETGTVWVGVHFGSRGLGHTIASNFLSLSQGGRWGERAKEVEVLLDLDSELGAQYWDLMNLAGEYAYAGREWVARKVVGLMGAAEVDLVHNHHNFAWKETHFGEEFVVVRKGATPAFPGQRGFVGGSMGDDAVILRGYGVGNDFGEFPDLEKMRDQRGSLYSTVHGAGRVMSRTEAAGKRDRRTGQLKRNAAGEIMNPGKVSPAMMTEWINRKGVVLRGGGLDESPHAYRRLPDVLRDQNGTVNVLHTLTPVVVVMAGANEFDPYKD